MRFAFRRWLVALGLATVLALPRSAAAQDRRDEQFYYPGSFNWQFLKNYPEAARLFNAFDYGHAVLYEVLYTKRGEAAARELEKQYRYLTTDLLVRPPQFAVAEEGVMPRYAKLAWRGKVMFDWAHILHRQIYDIYADDRIRDAQKDSLIERVTDYYLNNHGYAFTPVPKSMELMDEQYFSQRFRRAYPKFNGLIWAYHWLQVGLYEPFIVYRTPAERKAGVQATVARFWAMLENPPASMPQVMPMTAAVAPEFSKRHPRAAAIFDNLHMMHDIISDVLVADTVSRDRKRDVIYAQLRETSDSTRNIMSWEHWAMMGEMMGGVGRMGGPAVGLLVVRSPAAKPAGEGMPAMHHQQVPGMQHEKRARPPADSSAAGEGKPMEHHHECEHGGQPAPSKKPQPAVPDSAHQEHEHQAEKP